MTYVTDFSAGFIGPLTLVSDGTLLLSCAFGSADLSSCNSADQPQRRDDLPLFQQVRSWFDRYIADQQPDPRETPLATRATPFQLLVREAMLEIPYGQVITYGEIARRVEERRGTRTSARAVGGAVGRNPLCVIVPCHRVVGSDGSLTGFGGGLDLKVRLLEHEGIDVSTFTRNR